MSQTTSQAASTASIQSADNVKLSARTGVFGMIMRLWPHFMQHKLRFFGTLAVVFAVAIAGRLAVTLFGYAIDFGLRQKNMELIFWIGTGYLFLEGARCFLTFVHDYFFAKLGNHILFDIRSELIRHVESLPLTFFEKNPTGRIVTRVTSDVTGLGEVFTQGLISMFAAAVSLLTIIIAMAVISWKATLATLIIAPPLFWIIARISKRLLEVLRESKAKMAAINSFVAENVNGMRVSQLYGRSQASRDQFHALSSDYREQQMKNVRMYASLWPTVSFFNAASVGTALYFGGHLVLGGEVTTGAMVAFILHVRAFSDPLHHILEKYQNLQNSLSGAERVFSLLEEPAEEQQAEHGQLKIQGEIKIEDFSFRYQEGLPWALRGVSLSVNPGNSVALVGRTGSGKSTFIALLQRFYEPTEGRILIDGRSTLEYPRRLLRSRIGVVQQDTFLFRGTIADNISLGDPAISRERVVAAADMACLSDILDRRSDGLDAKVEERGANLSVGERQLIAFARILAFDPDILILDEATANIDSRTESLIQEATKRVRRGRTCFIIAHRISTILDCDQIVVLEGGRVVETGRHADLLKQDGAYAILWRAQLKGAIEL